MIADTALPQDPVKLFDGVPADGPVIVAVSGGSDSLALLMLANVWALKRGAELHAVTIDHGLRPEAAAEAAFVAGVCAGQGIPHSTLAWDGIKPTFGLQEAARVSRYALLDDFAHEIGAPVILTGHTSDDQAETVFMRAVRMREGDEAGGRGLCGMARTMQLYGGTLVIRPLLGYSRRVLREYLVRQGQSWVEDPSNSDESYERVRVRRMLEKDFRLHGRLLKLARASGGLRESVSTEVARYLAVYSSAQPGPVFHLDLAVAMQPANAVSGLAIQVMIALAGGREHLVARHRLQALFEGISVAASGLGDTAFTLGGVQIGCSLKREGREAKAGQNPVVRLTFVRETRHLSPLLLEPGEAAIWDGRMHVFNGTPGPVYVEPASRTLVAEIEEMRGKRFGVKPRKALLSTPVVHVQQDIRQQDIRTTRQKPEDPAGPLLPLVEQGSLPRGLELRLACVAIEHFCPQYDFALRDWVRGLDRHAAASLQP